MRKAAAVASGDSPDVKKLMFWIMVQVISLEKVVLETKARISMSGQLTTLEQALCPERNRITILNSDACNM